MIIRISLCMFFLLATCSPGIPMIETENEFLSVFQEAFQSGNTDLMMNLFCWDGAKQSDKELARLRWEEILEDESLSQSLTRSEIIEYNPKNMPIDYSRMASEGMRIPQEPAYKLFYEAKGKEVGHSSKGSLMIGQAGNRLCFIVPIPTDEHFKDEMDPKWHQVYSLKAIREKKRGSHDQAIMLMEKSVKHCEKTLGKGHRITLLRLGQLGDLYFSEEKYQESVKIYDDVLQRANGKMELDAKVKATLLDPIMQPYVISLEKAGKYEKASQIRRLGKMYRAQAKK